ncbi:MAG: hypothetical protein WCL70_10500 [Paludibacter sp.]
MESRSFPFSMTKRDASPNIRGINVTLRRTGYSGTNGGYVGFSFDGGNHFSNMGWNNGLTTGSTSYGETNMQNVNFKGFQQTVVQAESNAKDKYYEYCRINNENTQRFNDWIDKHIIFESELRMDYGAQIAGNINAFGGKLGFNVEKDTSPIMQLNINYNNGWSSAIYECGFMNKGEYSNGILENKYRNEWSGNMGVGYDKTYYSTTDFSSWGDMKSEKINCLFFGTTNLYNGHHDIYESQYTMDFGFNIAIFLGIQANIRFGYK